MTNKMPVIFSGHGSPMIALEDNELTKKMNEAGDTVIEMHGKPKAILSVSAHWYTHGTLVQKEENPGQIYDMYGFPKELYDVKYPVKRSEELSDSVLTLLKDKVSVNNSWGIDHGTWTVLVHMFPKHDIPVVQLSVNGDLKAEDHYEIGKKLSALREEGYLIFASGNVVHNLGRVEWDNPNGTKQADAFDAWIKDAVLNHRTDDLIHYEKHPDSRYAVPTPDHYLPLLYAYGAGEGDAVQVFNNIRNLGSMAMTGYVFGM
jgi:4,5-DOPA dioxygenase extradiol